jgi:hypothetical protein
LIRIQDGRINCKSVKKIVMKRIKFIIAGVLFLSLTIFTSCLKAGLDELPAFTDADITNIYFEYRYQDPTTLWTDGSAIVKYVTLVVATKTIDATAKTVSVTVSVPAASGTFTTAERAKVTLTNLVCKTNISTAAKIEPMNGAPILGTPGDFSATRSYLVTAADGVTTKTWTITVTALTKP